jgi:3-oxoadipate enol-lactonase
MHLEALAGMKLDSASLTKIKCRTLALTGKHDCIWSPAVGESLASKIPAARFEIVENAAHFPPIQDTQRVASRVMQFLDESVDSA